MPPARAFDHELLHKLYLENPDWPTYLFARELTADNRRKNPLAPVVNPATVDSAISRNRPAWEDELGSELGKRVQNYPEIAPPEGALHSDHKMQTYIRYLRHIARAVRGEIPVAESEQKTRRQALKWAAKMKAEKTVLDLTPEGEPIIRSARPDELDSEGELISLMAWKIPGWRQPARV